MRSRFFSTWASHHCASPRRRISSKRRSVESTPPLCAWCVGGALATLMKTCRLKKLLSRTSKRKPFTQQWPPVMVNFLLHVFSLDSSVCGLQKPRIGQALTEWAEKPSWKLATIFFFLFLYSNRLNWGWIGAFLFPHIFIFSRKKNGCRTWRVSCL